MAARAPGPRGVGRAMREPDAPRGRRFSRSYVKPPRVPSLRSTWSMITSESTGGAVSGAIETSERKPTPRVDSDG